MTVTKRKDETRLSKVGWGSCRLWSRASSHGRSPGSQVWGAGLRTQDSRPAARTAVNQDTPSRAPVQ